ncbi:MULTISPECIES: hypothetical protein [Photobacterium]|jgi:hypothetical protein|uniref:Uncharacterized protein n=1 Tax=Photobacterium profundum 3TCK TaxID=314280 RepID=Q1ZBC8_9GAMM|nr:MULTISPECIES: hypothetical protein [Photobacterium]EAS45214.1 hypothetical protein P3TCK_02536 [Photobacterium profundum 3TCK]
MKKSIMYPLVAFAAVALGTHALNHNWFSDIEVSFMLLLIPVSTIIASELLKA